MKLDNHQLGLKRIKVAISNPPKKAAAATNYPTEGGAPPLVPRAVTRGRVSQPLLISKHHQELGMENRPQLLGCSMMISGNYSLSNNNKTLSDCLFTNNH